MLLPQDLDGDYFPPFGVANDPDKFYSKYDAPDMEYNAMYLVKMNAITNSEAYGNLQAQLNSGKIKFLVDEKTAQAKLLGTQKGKAMNANDRSNYLKPYVLTSVLKDQMMNLRERAEGTNIKLTKVNTKIKSDMFSSFLYATYYLKLEEDGKGKKKRSRNFADYMFMS